MGQGEHRGDLGGAQGLGEHDQGQLFAHDPEDQGGPHRGRQAQKGGNGAAQVVDGSIQVVELQEAQDQAADDEDGPGDHDEFLEAVPGLAGHILQGGKPVIGDLHEQSRGDLGQDPGGYLPQEGDDHQVE